MRGEEVPITPSESTRRKRTRILSFTKASKAIHASTSQSGDKGVEGEEEKNEDEGEEEEEEEVLPESPIKPSRSDRAAGPSSGVFRPLFVDSTPLKRRPRADPGVFRSLFTEEISAKRRRDDDITDADTGIRVESSQDAINVSLGSSGSTSTALRPPSPAPELTTQSLRYNPKVKATWLSRKKSKPDRGLSESPEEADDESDEIVATMVKWRASGSLVNSAEKGSLAIQDGAEVPECELSEDDFPHTLLVPAAEQLSLEDLEDERGARHRPTASSASSKLNRMGPVWAAGESEEDGEEWDSAPEWTAEL